MAIWKMLSMHYKQVVIGWYIMFSDAAIVNSCTNNKIHRIVK